VFARIGKELNLSESQARRAAFGRARGERKASSIPDEVVDTLEPEGPGVS
jgi:hypothetical protein